MNLTNQNGLKIDFFSDEKSYHLHILQFLTFGYCLYRLISINYGFYGFLPSEIMTFPRTAHTSLVFPLSKLTTFTFIYDFLPLPSYRVLSFIQNISLVSAGLGLLGIFPRAMALINLIFLTHIMGIINATNTESAGGTLLIVALFCLAICSKETLYQYKNRIFNKNSSAHYNWPIKLFLILITSYYSMSGLNKLFDVGPLWGIQVNLENWALECQVRSISYSSRFALPELCSYFSSPLISDIAGTLTFIGELFFISIIFKPRLTWFFIPLLMIMHLLVYYIAGVNFLGNILLLLACFNWNAIFQRKSLQRI